MEDRELGCWPDRRAPAISSTSNGSRRSAASGRTGRTSSRAPPAAGAGRPAMAPAACLACSSALAHALQAEHAAVERHRPVGDVADGEDGRVGGARLLVDHDAVGAVQAGVAARARRWAAAPTPTRTASQAISRPSAEPHAGDVAVRALEAVDVGAELEARRRAPRDRPVKKADSVSQATRARMRGLALDHHRLGAQRAGRGGRLQPDIAAADHRQPLARAERAFSALGVGGACAATARRPGRRPADRQRAAPARRWRGSGCRRRRVSPSASAHRSWPPRSMRLGRAPRRRSMSCSA